MKNDNGGNSFHMAREGGSGARKREWASDIDKASEAENETAMGGGGLQVGALFE